jgi:signal transduction histidine kinase
MSSRPKGETVALSRRYATALRKLKLETSRREALQKALEASERHHRDSLEKSRIMQEHLRRLSHEILSAQEDERKRISRELHDEIGQTLTAINVKLAGLQREAHVNTTGLKKHIATTQRLVEESMNTVHRFARDLRPPMLDDLGLIPALHSSLKEFTKLARIPVHFSAFPAVERLHVDRRTILFRVAQEALANVDHHARASSVEVSIRKFRAVVRMEIHDNGRSFKMDRVFSDKKIKRLGLLGMRERVEMIGGTFAVESSPKTGTTIRADIPYRDVSPGAVRARTRSAQ